MRHQRSTSFCTTTVRQVCRASRAKRGALRSAASTSHILLHLHHPPWEVLHQRSTSLLRYDHPPRVPSEPSEARRARRLAKCGINVPHPCALRPSTWGAEHAERCEASEAPYEVRQLRCIAFWATTIHRGCRVIRATRGERGTLRSATLTFHISLVPLRPFILRSAGVRFHLSDKMGAECAERSEANEARGTLRSPASTFHSLLGYDHPPCVVQH